MKRIVFAIAAISLLASCGGVLKSRNATREVYLEKNVIPQHPMIAELDVDTKTPIHYSKVVKMKSKHGDQADMQKAIVLREAAQNNGAHVVVDPVYNIERAGRAKYKIAVDGFKGSYKNVRLANQADLELIEYSDMIMFGRTNEAKEKEFEAFGRKKNKAGRRAK